MLWVIIVAAIIIVLLASGLRHGGTSGDQRDPKRAFTAQQRAVIFSRAQNQCEHFSLFGRRCTATPTHADHIVPWSRGGATTPSNAQALCARHNLSKGSSIVPAIHVARLERRRRRYFPAGTPVDVVWKVRRF